MKNAYLNRYEIRRIRQGHPWIYTKSLDRVDDGLTPGDTVRILGPKGEFMGVGFYNPNSKIVLRKISKDEQAIDTKFFREKFKDALDYRDQILRGRSSFRLINSESDGLSGLIIDKYEDAVLFQIMSLGMEAHKAEIIQALQETLEPKVIIERNDVSSRQYEGLDSIKKIHQNSISGEELQNYSITIDNLSYQLDLIEGNKTGLYLDQVENHLKLRALCDYYEKPNVLDCFSYIGGFSLNAAYAHPHAQVTGIDQSKEANALARVNAQNNQLDSRCTFIDANVFDWLRNADPADKYDIVVLDPPSFTKNRYTVDNAIRGYKELHVRALKLLKNGGRLLTYSCSHHISESILRGLIHEAAADTQSTLREEAVYQQSSDHPIVMHIPESYYLKGFCYYKI